MAFARRFAINVTSNWLGVAVRILANVVLVPYLIYKLGDKQNGIWELVGGFLAYITLLDVGLTMAIRRFAARYAALKSAQDQNRLMSTAVVIYLIGGLLSLLIASGVAPFVPTLIDTIPQEYERQAVNLFFISGGVAMLRLLLTPFTGFLQGLQRYEIANLGHILGIVVRVGVIFLLLELCRPSVVLVGVAMLVAFLCEMIALVAFSFRIWPGLSIRPRHFNKGILKEIAAFGANAFVIAVAGLFMYQAPKFVIGKVIGMAAVTFFAVGLWVNVVLRQVVSGIGAVFMPAFSAAHALEDKKSIAVRIWKGSQLSNLITWSFVAGAIIYAEPLLSYWIGPEKLVAYWVLIILVLAEVGCGADVVAASALAGCGYLKWLMLSRVISTGTGFAFGILAVTVFDWGIEGVAVGIAVPNVVRAVWLPWYCHHRIEIPFSSFLARAVGRPLVAVAVIVVSCLALQHVYIIDSRRDLILSGCILTTVSCLVWLILGVSPEVRQQMVRPVLARLPGRRNL